MSECTGCGKPIEGDFELRLTEIYKCGTVWTYKFHGWECLTEFLIDREMVRAELISCA